MTVNQNPVDDLIQNGVPVDKSDFRSYEKVRRRLWVADADEIRNTDFSGQLGGLYMASVRDNFDVDTEDTTTEDDGANVIVDAAGNRWKYAGHILRVNNLSDVDPAVSRKNLGIDRISLAGDTDHTIVATDKIVMLNAALTAPRVWTLPAANSVNPGYELTTIDGAGGVDGENQLSFAATGADTIPSIKFTTPLMAVRWVSNGVDAWKADAGNSRMVSTRLAAADGANISGAQDRTVHDKLYERVSLLDFYVAVDTDITNAMTRCAAYAVGRNLRIHIPAGAYTATDAWKFDGNSNIIIDGDGQEATFITFAGTNGGIVYGNALLGSGYDYVQAHEGIRPHFQVHRLTLYTTSNGGHSAITAVFPYSLSNDVRDYSFTDLNIGPADWTTSSQYWNNGIYVYNGWRGVVENNTINQSQSRFLGTGINIDGLAPAPVITGNTVQYFDKAVVCGKFVHAGFTGALTGDFEYAERVVGSVSGAVGRYLRDSYGTSDLTLFVMTGTFVAGETLTGQTSGATLTGVALQSPVQGNEGFYIFHNELIVNNYGFYLNGGASDATPSVGLWIIGNNIFSNIANIYGRNAYQYIIKGNILYNLANGCKDIDLDGGNTASIVGNQILAGTFTSTTGIEVGMSIGFAEAMIADNAIYNRTTGIRLGSHLTSSNYPRNNRIICTTNIDNQSAIKNYKEAEIPNASSVTLTTVTQTNIVSLSLEAGTWDITAMANFTTTSATNIKRLIACLSTTSATLAALSGQYAEAMFNTAGAASNQAPSPSLSIPPLRVTPTSTTTYYFVVYGDFTGGSLNCWAKMSARRIWE